MPSRPLPGLARLVDLDDPLGAELDENTQRKPFAPSEVVAISFAIEERERKKAEARRAEGWKKRGDGKEPSDNLSEGIGEKGDSRDITAALFGWSGMTFTKAKAVVEAAREDPDLQDLVEDMDRTGNVSGAYNAELDRLKVLGKNRALPIIYRKRSERKEKPSPTLPTSSLAPPRAWGIRWMRGGLPCPTPHTVPVPPASVIHT